MYPFPQPAAPVSRDTYPNAQSKGYDQVVFIGGQGRRVFEAELNEAQEIISGLRQQTLSALIGNNDYDNNTGTLVGTGGLVTTGPTAGSIYYQGGYICAGGQIIRLGNPQGQTALSIFTVGDSTSAQAFVYVDSWNSIVNSTVDPTLIDPSYGVETAQRSQLNFSVVTSPKFPTGFGGTTWASYSAEFNTSPGHTWTLLAAVSNTHYPTIEADDIAAGATAALFGSQNNVIAEEFASQNATIASGLSSKPTYTEIPWATRLANIQVISGFPSDNTSYSTFDRNVNVGWNISSIPSALNIPNTAKIIRLAITFAPCQFSGTSYVIGKIPAPACNGLCLVSANSRQESGMPYATYNATGAHLFRVYGSTTSNIGDVGDSPGPTAVANFYSRTDSQIIELATGAALGQTFNGILYSFARDGLTQNFALCILFEGYWV